MFTLFPASIFTLSEDLIVISPCNVSICITPSFEYMTIPASPFLLNPAPAFFLPFEITSTDALPSILQLPVFVNTTP